MLIENCDRKNVPNPNNHEQDDTSIEIVESDNDMETDQPALKKLKT